MMYDKQKIMDTFSENLKYQLDKNNKRPVDLAAELLVKAFMRHANIGTTQRYIHIGKDELLETANKIEK